MLHKIGDEGYLKVSLLPYFYVGFLFDLSKLSWFTSVVSSAFIPCHP